MDQPILESPESRPEALQALADQIVDLSWPNILIRSKTHRSS